ncbi:hypothetical protein B9059_011705 [Enterobacter roggenkampii]|uniref:Uncharacterized protein n=1 Tax=Enterobacter roggenkampii TaxID=1812935 RepID=A0AAX1WJ10_9ENTR|nr:hypothetical protein B9059_011705 [Enterobacter roggenkampii]
MWLMKTLLTSGCTNQRGAGHDVTTGFSSFQRSPFKYVAGSNLSNPSCCALALIRMSSASSVAKSSGVPWLDFFHSLNFV